MVVLKGVTGREKPRNGLGTGHVTGSVNTHFYRERALFLSTANRRCSEKLIHRGLGDS